MGLNPLAVEDLVRRALAEDIGSGDLTTMAVASATLTATGRLITRAPGVICGQAVARTVFRALDPTVAYNALVEDGAAVEADQTVATVSGTARAVLTGERVALNFMQRMSGIATYTRSLVDTIKYYPARVTDTRKTTPGLRLVEKYAVRVGGGFNHRWGLYDGILVKDNHIAIAGGIKPAVAAARRLAGHLQKVEVEVTDLEELEAALEAGADVILLDNMDADTMRQAVQRVQGKAVLEASGGITADNLAEVAKTGVEYISIGALTHSSRSLDISLEINRPRADGDAQRPKA